MNRDGAFLQSYKNFEAYRLAQEIANKAKIGNVWAQEQNIEFLAKYIGPNAPFGLCHGTRNGAEQRWFRKYLPGCYVVGTEIAETAADFPYTIQWDFHEVKPGWLGEFDFIYSNSFDHSYDPEKAINAWLSCLNDEGVCIIEHSMPFHGPKHTSEADPFGANLSELIRLLQGWIKPGYVVSDVIPAPARRADMTSLDFIVLRRKT